MRDLGTAVGAFALLFALIFKEIDWIGPMLLCATTGSALVFLILYKIKKNKRVESN